MGPLLILEGLHWRHGDIRAVLGRLGGGRRLRRLVGFVADLRVGRVVFGRLVRREGEREKVLVGHHRSGTSVNNKAFKNSEKCQSNGAFKNEIYINICIYTEMSTMNHTDLEYMHCFLQRHHCTKH